MAKLQKGDAYNFVKENLRIGNDYRLACGDGRYEEEQSQGAIRVFGADFGMIMAFAATFKDYGIKYAPKELVDHYVKAKGKLIAISNNNEKGEVKLDFHCDEHNHDEGNIGCGHIAKASDPSNDGKYGSINSEEVKQLFTAFTEHPASHLTVLEGEHKEEGVLFVHGVDEDASYTVNSKNKKGKMFFVVDKDRIDKYIDSITLFMSEGLSSEINPESVKNNYNLQMARTASLLKADQIPHYKVVVKKGHFAMEQLPKQK
jgi:hypothetical protein